VLKETRIPGIKLHIIKLCEMLLFEDVEECYKFLRWYGINVPDELMDVDGDGLFELEQVKAPLDSTKMFRKTNQRFIESKHNNMSRKDIVK
jgi:hypothetical protein